MAERRKGGTDQGPHEIAVSIKGKGLKGKRWLESFAAARPVMYRTSVFDAFFFHLE